MARRTRVTLHIDPVAAAFRQAAADGLLEGMEFILGEATALVPHDEGDLERSGTASVDPVALRGAVSYDRPYAVRQHEDLTLRHAPGRTAKFLEGPFTREAGTMWALVAAAMRRVLR